VAEWFWYVFGAAGVLIAGIVSALAARKKPPEAAQIQTPQGELRWERKHLPILVVLDPTVYFWTPDVRAAIDWWNRELGFFAFVFGDEREAGSFQMTSTPGIVPIAASTARFHTRLFWDEAGKIQAAPIRVFPHADPGLRERIIAHELGHVAGLEHDPEITESVMHPVALPSPWILTANDRERLRKLYG
jgi:hypothetical protein